MGSGKHQWLLYAIDFGLTKQYINPKTQEHIRFRSGRSIVGTARFVSISTHLGMEQSRRDDIESIGYTLIYLATGSLPWQGFVEKGKVEDYNKIKEKKMKITIPLLCKGLPPQFESYFKYCKELRFTQKPNYQYLRGLFKQVMTIKGYINNYKYDWITKGKSNRASSREEIHTRLNVYEHRGNGKFLFNSVEDDIELGNKDFEEKPEEEESDSEEELELEMSSEESSDYEYEKRLRMRNEEQKKLGSRAQEEREGGKDKEDAAKSSARESRPRGEHSRKKEAKKKVSERKPELSSEARLRESKMIYLRIFKPQEYERLMKVAQEGNQLVPTNENKNLN